MDNPEEKELARAMQAEIGYARMLVARLERLSVDSYWAHRTSGLRGSLLRALEKIETLDHPGDAEDPAGDLLRLKILSDQGAAMLAKAAREIRGDETQRRS